MQSTPPYNSPKFLLHLAQVSLTKTNNGNRNITITGR